MAEHKKDALEPRDVVQGQMGVDLSKLGGQPPAPGHAPAGPPQPTHDDIAEQTRMEQQNRPDGTPDRDEKLVKIGRGQQTTGRL